MGYELNKLMQQFGVSSPTIMYSGGFTDAQRPAFDQYKADYMKRMNETSLYGPPQATPHLKLPAQQSVQQWADTLKPPVFALPPSGDYVKALPTAQQPTASGSSPNAAQTDASVGGVGSTTSTSKAYPNWYQDAVYNHLQDVQNIAAAPVQEYQLPTVAGLSPEQLSSVGLANSSVGKYQPYIDTSLQKLRGYADGGLVEDDYTNGIVDRRYMAGVDGNPIQSAGQGDVGLRGSVPKLRAQIANTRGISDEDMRGALAQLDAQVGQQRMPTVTQEPKRMDMQSLLAKYLQPSESGYASELNAARANAAKHQAAFEDLIQKSISGQEEAGPSKSEMYYRLAQAFGTPGKTGHFSEGLANAAGAMSDYEKEKRTAKQMAEQSRLKLGLDVQDMRMKGAKDDIATLRTLASDESKNDREVKSKLLADYIKSGQPQSEAGKIAQDAGLRPGTPEFARFVDKHVSDKLESGNMFKQIMANIAQGNLANAQANTQVRTQLAEATLADKAKLTPQEMRLKQETEVALATMGEAYKDLKDLERLSPQMYDGSLLDQAQYRALAAIGSKDPKVVNTGIAANIMKQGALSTAASTLKTQISDSDIKMLQGLQGLDSKSAEERDAVVKAAKRRMLEIYKTKKAQLDDINAGKYRSVQPIQPIGQEE